MIWTVAVLGSAALFTNQVRKPTAAETNATPVMTRTQADTDAIRDMARKSTYAYEQVRFLSNKIGARLSGSPQAAAAVTYVAQQMRALGLDVRLEPVTVRHWVRGREEESAHRAVTRAGG
jgi:carboxypeptidase Q